jgi:Cu2+-exporting ATPase
MQLVPETNLSPEPIPTTEKIILDVEGMKCAGCVKAVERQLMKYPGVKNASVNLATEVAVVESETGAVDPEALAKQLTAAGFPSQPRRTTRQREVAIQTQSSPSLEEQQRQATQSAQRQLVIAVLLLFLSGIGHFDRFGSQLLPGLHNIWFHCLLATVAILIPGRAIIVDGWLGLRQKAPNMNTLVGLGTLTAYTASLVALLFPQLGWECFFDEPVMMLGFILLGRTLEKQARNRTAAALKQLLQLQPQTARLLAKSKTTQETEEIIEIPADRVKVGEWLQVLPGDKIPVDGVVVDGQTTVDESMLTGEAVPVLKQPGDTVTAGTINHSGAIAIQATRTGNDTTLAQIVSLVEAAQLRKAPVQKLADTVAGYFTYGVLIAALATFLFWYFFGSRIWPEVLIFAGTKPAHHSSQLIFHLATTPPTHYSPLLLSLKLAISVMVVACPCALGLATPTAILVGTAIAAESGLLIKGGDILEKAHQLDTVVFDKTGTLTTGNPTVTDCLVLERQQTKDLPVSISDPQHLLRLAAAVESGTCHPLATAIRKEAQLQQLFIPFADRFHTEPGLGVCAVVEENLVLLGNWDWLRWHQVTIDETAQNTAQALAAEGKTVVGVAVGRTLAGLIAVQDTPRPDAKQTVEKLQQMGLRVILLSGDTPAAATAIAQQLGLDSADVMASVPPAKKAAVIQSLQNGQMQKPGNVCGRHVVAMVGDGINDAPALSQADIGIALHTGTDVAVESADIVLMRNCLTDVVRAIQFSRATFNKIRQNLFWAFAYNTLGIPLAGGILLPSLHFALSPASAAALMALSSVCVVTNSLLLQRFGDRVATP